ncbi:MAG: hypothetical protein ABEI99_06685 [Halobaculum sp.]
MVPLFGAVPGGPELIVIGFIFGVLSLLPAIWVYSDAEGRGNDHALAWALAVGLSGLFGNLFGLAVVLGLYFVVGRN